MKSSDETRYSLLDDSSSEGGGLDDSSSEDGGLEFG